MSKLKRPHTNALSVSFLSIIEYHTIKYPSETNDSFLHTFLELNQVQLVGTVEHEVFKFKYNNNLRFFLKTRNTDGSQ